MAQHPPQESTIQLLYRALAHNPSNEFWSDHLKVSKTALAVAKHRGRLSPVIAGHIARLMGEDINYWVATAALEAEKAGWHRAKLDEQRTHLQKR